MIKWCFIDSNPLDYRIDTPEKLPLGGSQAALCYLARELASQGHPVSLLNQHLHSGNYLGVEHLHYPSLSSDFWQQADFDLVVSLNAAEPLLNLPTRLLRVFWNQHNDGVPGIEKLPQQAEQIDKIVFVSHWQHQSYQQKYGLSGEVLENACPPFYRALEPEDPASFLAARPGPLTLAYSSTPNRGLKVLIAIFPALRLLYPELHLKVFSSLKVYQAPAHEEQEFEALYAECQQLEGVEYLGSVPQPELYQALKQVHIWAYPNIYQETSCIAALEAMAAGCRLVTTRMGALPETTAGYARLVEPYTYVREFGVHYFEALNQEIACWQQNPAAWVPERLAQSAYVLKLHNWPLLAQRWQARAAEWLQEQN